MTSNENYLADMKQHNSREQNWSKNIGKIVKHEKVNESDNSDAGLKSVFVEDSDKTEKILSKAEKDLKKLQIEERRNPKRLDSRLLQNINSYLTNEGKISRKNSHEETKTDSTKSSVSSQDSESSVSESSNSDEEECLEKDLTEWQLFIAKKKERAIKSLQNVFDEINISGKSIREKFLPEKISFNNFKTLYFVKFLYLQVQLKFRWVDANESLSAMQKRRPSYC